MKKKDDELINEDAIKNLIQYAEEENNDIDGDINTDTKEIGNAPKKTQKETEEETEEETTDSEDESLDGTDEDIEETEDENDTEYDSEEEFDEEFLNELSEDNSEEDLDEEPENKSENDGYNVSIELNKKTVVTALTVILSVMIIFMAISSGLPSKIASVFTSSNEIEVPTPRPEEEYSTEIDSEVMTSLESASESQFAKYNDGVVCARMNYMAYINAKGETEWEMNTAVVDPILKSEGDYILLTENGRNKICLYNGNKLLYDVDDPDTIVNANLSEKGDVVVVTNKQNYKGGISVYNKSGAQIFSWASGSDMVMCADISSSSRRVAVALLNTDETAKTSIQLFNVNEKESYSKIEVENTVIFDMKFTDDILNAIGDNRAVGISEKGKIIYNNSFDDVQLTHSAIDDDGNVLLSFDDVNMPMINMYNKKGVLKESVALAGVADFIDIRGKKILYNKGRNVYFGTINAKIMTKYTASMDIKNLMLISDDTFVIVYSNSIETVTV
jgi:hypothetical protein